MAETLWQGRFEGTSSEALQALNDSLPFDQAMYRQDIAGSRAQITMLATVGLVTEDERDQILAALDQVESEIEAGTFVFVATDEDIHTAVERGVTAITAAGAKLHTGRSRNDQVVTDLRLWTKEELGSLAELVISFQETLLKVADAHSEAYLPAYTHLQQAMPVMLSHYFLAHGWALSRDVDRLLEARRRSDVSVLGAGALAGSSLPTDPDQIADLLGFASRFENSLDSVGDRDFVADSLYAMAVLGIHLSRIGEEMILWASSEFGFVSLDDAFSTGSSMMPQKKNPDIAELARGKSGRVIGNLAGLLTTLKGLPMTYNKDLQEDKEPLFDSFRTVRLVIMALDGMLSTMTINIDTMAAQANSPYAAATDLADFLVLAGTPFREAHGIVGGLVRSALAGEDTLPNLVTAHPALGPPAAKIFAPGASARGRNTPGGGGPEAVAVQRTRFVAQLAADRDRL